MYLSEGEREGREFSSTLAKTRRTAATGFCDSAVARQAVRTQESPAVETGCDMPAVLMANIAAPAVMTASHACSCPSLQRVRQPET